MIPLIPIATSIIQAVFYKKVTSVVTEYGASLLLPEPRLEPRVKLKGKKTYAGIAILIVALASAFAPDLGITEEEVSGIIVAIAGGVGGIVAIYGRWKA